MFIISTETPDIKYRSIVDIDQRLIYKPHGSDANEILTATFSMFNGKNEILLYGFEPNTYLLYKSFPQDSLVLSLLDEDCSSIKAQTGIVMEGFYWDYEIDCIVFRFIPTAIRRLQTYVMISEAKSCTLTSIVNKILSKVGLKGHNLKVTPLNPDKKLIFKSFYDSGLAIDILSRLFRNNLYEWFAYDYDVEYCEETICFDMKPTTCENKNNTWGRFRLPWMTNNNNAEIYMGSSPNVLPLPGSLLALTAPFSTYSPEKIARLAWMSYHWSKGTSKTSFFTCDAKINEYDYASMLPPELKEYMLNRLRSMNTETYLTKVTTPSSKPDNYEHTTIKTIRGWDAAEQDIPSQGGVPMRSVRASPYAGKTVGLQFPENKDAIEVATNPDGHKEMSVSVGEIFQKDGQPKRKSPDDFRLTLPDGGTIYYDNAKGNLYISAKTKIVLGTNANQTSQDIPTTVSNEYPAARQEDPTTSDIQTDSAFWSWMTKFQSALSTWVPVPSDGGAVLKALLSSTILPFPTKQDGKIKTGSSKVEIG